MSWTLDAVCTYGRRGASARVRLYQWLERVPVAHRLHPYVSQAAAGRRQLTAHPGAVLHAERALRQLAARPLESVLVHRGASPFGRGDIERRLLRAAEIGVYDFDDALQWEPLGGGIEQRIWSKMAKALAGVQAATRVIAGNTVLAGWAAAYAREVVVIPSCVEPALYRLKRDYDLGEVPVIVWVGSGSTERYLSSIAGPLLAVHRRTGAQLLVIGASAGPPSALDAMTRRITWTEARVHNRLADCDVGIMPLVDGLYERGKCAYKLIQYAAAGLPALGSPVGVNADLLARLGMPAPRTDAEWVDALLGVLEAPAGDRARWGATGRQVIERDYSYRAWQDAWLDAIGCDGHQASGRGRSEPGPPREPV